MTTRNGELLERAVCMRCHWPPCLPRWCTSFSVESTLTSKPTHDFQGKTASMLNVQPSLNRIKKSSLTTQSCPFQNIYNWYISTTSITTWSKTSLLVGPLHSLIFALRKIHKNLIPWIIIDSWWVQSFSLYEEISHRKSTFSFDFQQCSKETRRPRRLFWCMTRCPHCICIHAGSNADHHCNTQPGK